MRAVALHPDVIVFVSDVWQTTCTAVRSGVEGFVIDSPVYPEELRALPEVLEHAGFPVSGLLVTHGDWDHLLGRLAFPEASLGCAPATADRLAAELGDAQRRLRAFDAEHYVQDRTPLGLVGLQALPVPGHVELGGDRQIELHEAGGHTADGVAYRLGWAGTLVCGDYLSPVEIPMLSPGGSAESYRATLARLAPLVSQAEWVVPGHGAPLTGARAGEILAEDDAYLQLLTRDPTAAMVPRSRSTAVQQRIHHDNLSRLAPG
ncbi:MAG: MBL fold metallo-hydrolase [Solirubrobacteraceae bacterium]|jgi:glyoxylase-like metal-dependent hydrolase (beta-lactamase superfamily II)